MSLVVVEVTNVPELRIAGMNSAAERKTGCPSGRMEGRMFADCLGAELGETLTKRSTTCVRTGKALQFEEHPSLITSGQWYSTMFLAASIP